MENIPVQYLSLAILIVNVAQLCYSLWKGRKRKMMKPTKRVRRKDRDRDV